MSVFIEALSLVATPFTLMVIFLSAAFGLFVGAIPGLTATMATALLVPFSFYMDPIPAIAAIISCTTMAIIAGDIPGALMRIPGTPASAAYVDEAFAMTKAGRPARALGISICSSSVGGMIGFAALLFTAPLLGKVALQFSSFEYFWLALLGLSCAALISSGSRVKGTLSLLIGLFIALVGLDPLTASPRFSMGWTELMGGISFIPAMIGMFALSEILRHNPARPEGRGARMRIGNPLAGMGRVLWNHRLNVLRGSALGTAIGALPGAGGDLGAWIAYAVSKRFSKTPEKFGTGHAEGLVEASATNNAALSSAWIPAMVFGIPGDAVTAIAVGVLVMKGMNPGPTIFINNPQNFYAVMIIFALANLLIVPLGWLAVRSSRAIFRLSRTYLNATILAFCIVGSYAVNNSVFGIGVMLMMGVVAFILESKGFPIAPIILGIVIGPLVEQNFLTSMIITDGNLLGFFERPIAAGLGVFTISIWVLPLVLHVRKWLRAGRAVPGGNGR
ncbi:MAG: tripartite tricarboxylate transporter permease [Tropicimonas sp.]|uniref:tripartite tricarboxylate transporter permease n=1 Tax=Tropicimonas sp. TaxID=2067044 RepID=UPI003A881FF1